ncbi:MAG: hypothetical protein GY715_08840 [Planctomycetes bacterium]|nr:hypothetical protein [Planctomycetota bacterium]
MQRFLSAIIVAFASTGTCFGDVFTDHFYHGKLVGVTFRASDDGQAQPQLQFLVSENYTLGRLQPTKASFLFARVEGSVDLARVSPERYFAVVEAVLPADVRLGADCLVHVEWVDLDQRIISIEAFSSTSREQFFERHGAAMLERERRIFERQRRSIVDVTQLSTRIVAGMREELAGLSVDAPERPFVDDNIATAVAGNDQAVFNTRRGWIHARERLEYHRMIAGEQRKVEIDRLLTELAAAEAALPKPPEPGSP